MIDLIAAEWLKLRTVRSTYYLLGAGALVLLVLAAFSTFVNVISWDGMSESQRADFASIGAGIQEAGDFAPLIFGTFGALAITAEYATGAIRPSLVAVPQRRAFLAAKTVATAAVGLVVSLLLVFTMYGTNQAIIGNRPIGAPLSEVWAYLLAMPVTLTVVVLIGLGLGTITRSTAGAIVTLVGIVYVLPALGQLPEPWGSGLGSVTLTGLQAQLAGRLNDPIFSPPVALMLLAAWATATLATAGLMLKRRDA